VMHFSKLNAGDLVLLDRGYACLWLFDLILSLGADFCARMPSNWKCVQLFLKSSKREQIIRLPLAPVEKTRCLRQGIRIGSFALRLIRLSVQQDFHARILSKDLTSMLGFHARETIASRNQDFKRPRRINFAHCLSAMKSAIPLLPTRPVETLATLRQALSALFLKSDEPLRPGRRNPHKPKRKNEFYTCYKRIG